MRTVPPGIGGAAQTAGGLRGLTTSSSTNGCRTGWRCNRSRSGAAGLRRTSATLPRLRFQNLESLALLTLWIAGMGGIALAIATTL